PDFTIVYGLKRCPCGCSADLCRQPLIRCDKRQVFDLPPQKLICTEHRVEVKLCPNSGREVLASFPVDVKGPTQYGPRFNAWLLYLRCQQLIPLERISQMCFDLFGRLVSEATVQAAVTTTYHALDGFESRTADLIAQAPVAHADETGTRVAGSLHWLHVASTKKLTWYGVHRKRGKDAIECFALLPRFAGRLIHDCWSAYLDLSCAHGICNAHLLRELTFLHEIQHQKWAKRMLNLLLRMHKSVAKSKARAGPSAAPQRAAWTRKYKAVLRRGFAENPRLQALPGPKRRGRPKHTKAQNLLLRLKEHERSGLAFLHDSNVPFSNNQAEQDLRMMKVQQKISGTFRTLEGANMFARIRAYLSTVRKNQRNVFEDTLAALRGQPFMPTIAA
ncbi:MAG: IS66 family transposase, partial [Candidatus Micrarchaeaceae archaeon]